MPSATNQPSLVIHNNCAGLSVIPNTSVSYVNLLQGRRDARHSFVCVEKKHARIQPSSKSPKTAPAAAKEEGESAAADLAGSPLKDDFRLEVENMSIVLQHDHFKIWSDTEECYSGINVQVARAIVAEISEQLETNVVPQMWILCDGADVERALLLEYESDEQWCRQGIVHANPAITIETVRMEDLIAEHTKTYLDIKTFDTEIESTYHLQPTTHVRVQMSFQRQLPSFTYFQGAQVTLRQTLSKGDDPSERAASFWSDILTLNYIRQYILDCGGHRKHDPVYECGTGMRLREIKEEIATIFTTILFSTGHLNDHPEEEDQGLAREELEAIVASASSRDYTDITDSLWNLLKCCASAQDLQAAFNYMFHFAQVNNVVNVPSNQNHLATLIREISAGRLTNLCLSGTQPLELLLEIGLEKVEKDYAFIFVRSNTTTQQELEASSRLCKENVTVKADGMVRKSVFHSAAKSKSMVKAATSRTTLLLRRPTTRNGEEEDGGNGFHYSDFDENEVEMKLCKLAHYHGILEHLLHLKTSFNNADVFALVMEHMLQQPMHYPFRVVKERGFKDLEMEVVNNSLLAKVKDTYPNVRRVSFVTKKSLVEMKTTFVHSLDPIFPCGANELAADVVVIKEEDQGDEKALLSQQQYHQYLYRNIKSKW